MEQSSTRHISRDQRRARGIAMRWDQKLTLRESAARVWCGIEPAQRDINRHMAELDAACVKGVAAMRAEKYEQLEKMASLLETAIDGGDLSHVTLKTSE